MFDINCHQCEATHLIGSCRIRSMHNTSEGPIAYVECPEGHFLVVRFGAEARYRATSDIPVASGTAPDSVSVVARAGGEATSPVGHPVPAAVPTAA